MLTGRDWLGSELRASLNGVSSIKNPISQMRKLRHKEVKSFAQRHTVTLVKPCLNPAPKDFVPGNFSRIFNKQLSEARGAVSIQTDSLLCVVCMGVCMCVHLGKYCLPSTPQRGCLEGAHGRGNREAAEIPLQSLGHL